MPADYYSSPVDARPLVASWVPFGCGTAALLFLVALFAGGAVVANGGISRILDFSLEKMSSEVERMFASDVTPAQRSAFVAEMTTTRANVRSGKADFKLLQPVVTAISEASSDKLVNASETQQIMTALQAVNAAAAKPKPPKKSE
jgi:hypothetical protein